MSARRLKPSELARQDQYLAFAEQIGRDNPRAQVLTTYYAPSSIQCCWCNCPDEAHPGPLGCAGCPEVAYYMVRGSHGVFSGNELPICERHYSDFQRMMAGGLGGPFAVLGTDILDGAT